MAAGLSWQGMPALNWGSWAVIVWLALVNTALAFTLWNHTLRTLTAAESSVVNNTMLAQIAILAWLFLGENLDMQKITGICFAMLGTLFVQSRSSSGKPRSLGRWKDHPGTPNHNNHQ